MRSSNIPSGTGFFLHRRRFCRRHQSRTALDLGLRVPWLVGGIAVLGSIALPDSAGGPRLLEDTANGRFLETSPGRP